MIPLHNNEQTISFILPQGSGRRQIRIMKKADSLNGSTVMSQPFENG